MKNGKVWKKAEDERRAEEERKAEEKRKAEEAQRAEEERKAEEKRKAEEAKRAEEERRLEAQKNACSAKGAGYVWSDGECKYDISKDPSVPSIETISNACWLYGRNNGVRLLDYSSNEIVRDGNYFQIVMSHDDGSRWKCWYRPSDGDVFVEKIYSWL